jgi:putative ABC transport system substrate-binding protein
MRRRGFITLLGGAAAAWPLAARGQSAMPVIGFLNPNPADYYPEIIAAFHGGLRETGFVENKNVTILYRWADGYSERLPALAADLVGRGVNVIAATGGGRSAFAAKAATTTIPIVFNSADDPVKAGLVASLNRPGGNLTGVSRLSVELLPKRVELLREVVPSATAVAYLIDSSSAAGSMRSAQEAAQLASQVFGIELLLVNATVDDALEAAFTRIVATGAKALLIAPSSYFNSRGSQLGELSAHHGLPAVYQVREFATGGGLMSYGPPLTDAYRTVGIYTGRVLKGERPADLPVQQQTRVELIVNLKAAKALGLSIPLPLLGRADEVIE